MKTKSILLAGIVCVSTTSIVESSDFSAKIINYETLILTTKRNETIENKGKCKLTAGKINNIIFNNDAKATLEVLGEDAYAKNLYNNVGTVEQSAGIVTYAVNSDVYNQTGGTVTQVANLGEYNIDGGKINSIVNEKNTSNDNEALKGGVLNICGQEGETAELELIVNKEEGTVNHYKGTVSFVNNICKEKSGVYNQHGGTIEEVKNDGNYVYRSGTINKFTQNNPISSLAIIDNAEFELKANNTITNGKIVLGESGDEATTGMLILNNGTETIATVITNANSQLTINERSSLKAFPGTVIMTGALIDVKGKAHFEGINNDVENVVALAGTVNVTDGATFNAINVNEADGLGEDDKTHTTLVQTGGMSNINAFVTFGKDTNITGGTVNAQGDVGIYGNITTGDNKATLNLIGQDSILLIKNGTTILDGGSDLTKLNWEGNVFLNGGKLVLKNIVDDSAINATKVNKTGYLTAQSGELFIQGDTVLLNGGDIIRDDVDLTVEGNIEVQENGTMYVSGDDDVTGKMSVNGGNLHLKDVTTDEDTYLEANTGILKVREGGTLVLKNDNDQIGYNVDLNLAGNLVIDNNNETGVTLNNIGTDSGDNWDANIELKKGVLTLENVSKSTTDVSQYEQSGGELRLFQTSLTLNKGTRLNGGTVSFGVKVNSDDNNDGLLHASPVLLHAPVRRIKDIEAKALKAENTGLLRADPNPIMLRADQNSSELNVNNGEDNNVKVQIDATNSDAAINIGGIKSETGTPTTFIFNEGSNIEAGLISVGDSDGNANVVSVSNNTVIGENVEIAIKDNTVMNVDGASTKVSFNTDKPNAQFNGMLNHTEGTVMLLGKGEKNGVLKSLGGNLEIGNGTTETKVTLNKNDDKISCNSLKVASNTTFTFSGNKVEAPVKNQGELNVVDGNISASIKSDDPEQTGVTNIQGNTNSTAEINQGTINIAEGAQFSTTADVKADNLNIGSDTSLEVKNSNIVSNKLTGDDTNEYKFNNANLFLVNQDTDFNGEITTSGDKAILYINDKKFNNCVNVEPGCNTYLVSGQIGAVTIPWGARLTADNAGAVATNNEAVNAGADINKSGTLVVEKDDQVAGDLVLGEATIKIQDKTIIFHDKSTYEAWRCGQHQASTEIPGPFFQRTGNGTLILENSNITIPSIELLRTMDNIKIGGSSNLSFGGGNVDYFKFSGNVSTIDDEYGSYNVKNDMTIGNTTSNTVNFKIDLYARSNSNKKHDTFGSDTAKLVAGNGTDAVINISDWKLHDDLFGSDAPIDRNISMQIFKFGSVQDGQTFTFTASDKEVLTPIGYYKLNSKGNGLYSLDLFRYNPGVFRGQIVTTAQLQNQLAVSDTIFNHVMTDAKTNCNDYIVNNNGITKNRYLWAKLYGKKEKLYLNQDFDVDNNTYGAILGFDFNPVLKGDWSFIPTVFIAYNHAKQEYNDDYGARQDGGQVGFATTLSNGLFKLGAMAYGGYYTNNMTIPNNVTDNANNWFCGASVRCAYDLFLKKNLIVQPNVALTYNRFGSKDWKTDFGSMDMKLSSLNGTSVIPGVNIILQRGAINWFGSVQYVNSFDNGVAGQAGNVKLPKVKLRKKYIQYGVGLHSNFSKNFSANLQATKHNLGMSGFGVQLGVNWIF